MFNNHPPPFPDQPRFQQELRQLVFMWAICCCSPLLYLSVSWLLIKIKLSGFYPLSHDVWISTLIGIALFSLALQLTHFFLKLRTRRQLATHLNDPAAFMKLLTRRLFTLILLCELPVFTGFCLFIIDGNLNAIFGFGLVSMLLYAQSHPRSVLPVA